MFQDIFNTMFGGGSTMFDNGKSSLSDIRAALDRANEMPRGTMREMAEATSAYMEIVGRCAQLV